MVEHKKDRIGNRKLIRGEEQEAWEALIFKFSLEDVYHCDDFDLHNLLNSTWSNKKDHEAVMIRLDRFHMGEWANNRGGKI